VIINFFVQLSKKRNNLYQIFFVYVFYNYPHYVIILGRKILLKSKIFTLPYYSFFINKPNIELVIIILL